MIVEEKFSMEVELRDLMARNKRIAGKIMSDPELIGKEYPAGSWFIDLLYRDADKNYVVIELKKDSSSDRTIGQVQRYITWVRENLAGEDTKVRGVIICGSDDEKLAYAARSAQDVTLVVYSIDVSLSIISNNVGYRGCVPRVKNRDSVYGKMSQRAGLSPSLGNHKIINAFEPSQDEVIEYALQNSRKGAFHMRLGKKNKLVIEHRIKGKFGNEVIKNYKRHRIVSMMGTFKNRVDFAIQKRNKTSEENNTKWLAYWESRLIEFN